MATTVITPQTAGGGYDYTGQTLSFDAMKFPTNDNSVVLTGRELFVMENTTGSPIVVTVSGEPTSKAGRDADASITVPANGFSIFGPVTDTDGWKTSAGLVIFQAAATGINVAVVVLGKVS